MKNEREELQLWRSLYMLRSLNSLLSFKRGYLKHHLTILFKSIQNNHKINEKVF